MIGNRFYTWFKNYYQWVGGAFSETLLLPLVRATAGLRAGAIRYDETTGTVETYDGTNWNAIPSATGFVPNSRTITINGTTFDLSTNRIYSVGTVTSVGLSMPAAFTVSGSPVTGAGSLSVTGAGLATQYVRGDGTLANFPTTQGGGSSVSYYLNGSVNQGTFSGSTYYEMNRTPILGAGTNFSRNTDGYIASFITDAGDPGFTEIPGGNFNLELYFSASSGGGNPSFYVELYKYDGSNFTLIASNQSSPDSIVGATKDAYFTAIAIPQTSLTITDRLAIRVYVTVSGRTITFHTENNNLAQIITTFSTGINTINGLTKQVQFLTTGTGGTDFNINSTNSTHTFNIPTASATNRGALSSADWTTFNAKQAALNGTGFVKISGTTISYDNSTYYLASNPNAYIALTNLSAGTGISYDNTTGVITNAAPDQTVSITASGTTSVSGTYPNFTISSADQFVGTVTSVGLSSATSGVTITDSPVTVSGTIGIAIATANGSQQGLLSGTDWTTFNNKQNTLTLTTSGSSGAATLIGATLNVPQYQAQGNYITSLTGEATASGPGAASVTLSTTAVTGKLLTGLNLSGGGTIASTDSILQAFGKVQNQISAMVGGVTFQGVWNASTNTPTLTSSTGTKGHYYIVDVSGTTNLNGITDWRVGDWAIFNGSTWDKVDNTDAVSSVNGFTGAVSLTTSHIAEGTNLYYLDSRSRTAISLTTSGSSGAATYDNVSGIINVPQYTLTGLGGVPTTRSITINGRAFDLSADRTYSVGTVTSVGLNSTTSGITITNTPVTGSGALTINIATASGSQNGLLSSTDWTTFNNKIGGSGTSGQVAYFNGTSTITGESNLFWDASNDRLGIGTGNPSANLQVAAASSPTIAMNLTGSATSGTRGDLSWYNSSISTVAIIRATAVTDNVGTQLEFYTRPAAGSLTQRMTLDASGNLGLGVTPSAWISSRTVLQINSTSTSFTGVNNGVSEIWSNSFLDSTGTNRYIATGFANLYQQNFDANGGFRWFTAPSGTAGNAISFTQAMTLDASGRLLVGFTTNQTGAALQVSGNGTFAGSVRAANTGFGETGGFIINNRADAASRSWRLGNDLEVFADFGIQQSTTQTGSTYATRLYINNTGNVGIGTTTPATTFHVDGNSAELVRFNSTATNGSYLGFRNSGTLNGAIGTGANLIGGITNSDLGLWTTGSIVFQTNGAVRARLDTSGNLGLGVTPSAWGSGRTVLQLGNDNSYVVGSRNTVIGNNAYNDGSNWRYLTSSVNAHIYAQLEGGSHAWYTAPSGTAGNAISFTQAMTLDASGRLAVGTTSIIGDDSLPVQINAAASTAAYFASNNAGGYGLLAGYDNVNGYARLRNLSNTALTLETNNTERMRITSGGNVGIGTADTQTFRLAVDGPNVYQGDTSTTIRVFDTTSATTGTGGGISFAGYTSGTSSIINTFSYIKGGKENSTAGNFASYLSFGTRVDGGAPTERMRITSGGNVGIGVTTVNKRLEVAGSAVFSGTGYDGTSAEIQLNNTTASTGRNFVLNSFNSGGFQIADKTAGGATRLTITSAGNTELAGSIKTAAPSGGTAAAWKLGTIATTSDRTVNRYIEVEVGGNSVWIHASLPD